MMYGAIDDHGLRNFRRLMDKKARYVSHLNFLENCEKNNVIPNGFHLKWRLNLGSAKQNKQQVHNILGESSHKLMKEAMLICKRELRDIENTLTLSLPK